MVKSIHPNTSNNISKNKTKKVTFSLKYQSLLSSYISRHNPRWNSICRLTTSPDNPLKSSIIQYLLKKTKQIKKKTYCCVKFEHTASPNWRSRLKPTETEMCFLFLFYYLLNVFLYDKTQIKCFCPRLTWKSSK